MQQVPNTQLNTGPYQKHVPYSVAYYLHCSYDNSLSKLKIYREKDCIEWFMRELHEISQNVDSYLTNIIPMEKLTLEQGEKFHSARICHICEKPFKRDDIRHRDHDHFTGKYRGFHFFIKALAKEF